jgi:Uma2 family endonuclease
MSPDFTTQSPQPSPLVDWWDPPSPPTDLIFDDGEPLESNRHRIAMNVLIDSLLTAYEGKSDFFAGGNMFVYYSRQQVMNRDFRGPDFFVALDVDGSRERQGWVVWEEDGRYPDVIVELMSPGTAHIDRGVKKDIYERTFHTADYFIYDPFDPNSLQGWHLDNTQHYQPIPANDSGWLWCETLGLWLGTWEGSIRREPPTGTCHWLRFYDRQGQVVLLPEEIAQRQTQHVEQERQRAEQERQRAEQAQQLAEQERQRAEQERQRAEQAEQQTARLLAHLRAQGINPDDILDSST